MTAAAQTGRTLGFTVLYLAATYAGRLTVMDHTSLSLVWPAAGVAVVWFCAQRRARWRWLDAVALTVVTMVVNLATGASAPLAAAFVVANLAQVWVFLHLFSRFAPHLWGAGGDALMARSGDVWRLLGVAFAATAVGAAIGPTAVWWVNGAYSWPATAVWLTRNTASILLIGAVGLRIGWLVSNRAQRCPFRSAGTALAAAWRRTPGWRITEYVALSVVSIVAYLVGFALNHGLPLAFPLLAVTVWAGLRLATSFVMLHDLVLGGMAILFTLHGYGPFAGISAHPARALVAQAFVGMVAVVGLTLALSRDERVALMRRLTVREREASDQARLMTTVIESMSDGLAVMRADGRVLVLNPACAAMLGTAEITDATRPTDVLFHPDGRPVAQQERPYLRALAGERLRDVDYVIRTAGHPDGRIVSVSATPLPTDADGGRSAVVMFHDVTAARRHRDELASFAGVVAHDLLNPLTTIDGWTDAAVEELTEAPDGPAVREARASLTRVRRAADRMRHLIDGLLAYTTARDATVQPVDVPLRDLVDDIVAARVDLATAAGTGAPRFTVGDLDPVAADPVLVRQLLDNLVGNAIKYTAPGRTPHVTITTAPAPDGRVVVRIADNGLGIPAGQHHAIFGNFHRAHRDAGITGTGLGLAICQRIVHRHGGTITAADHPGGGSVFTFTLPRAGASPARPRLQTAGRAV
ncbi:hypothetical protein GCM10010124_40020 [Pilimelia terevasa]|uniref:Sensor-like histidine kinase SenX3 n=1 Tax=Pilimelia terevasa TaxID=53372 RepID=A0A8J3FKT4_9ACTN|nr:ATP-binding protein [Pilimelia terevasa]GGK43174.1 hypothetical protein GCM10010124_40020 [Pilimelia terevasa]